MRTGLLVLLLALGLLRVAHAQPGTVSSGARRDELAKVQEMLGDPDPLVRLSNMESIIKSDDALKLQVALRIAFTGDDKELRALALRAYIATRKEVSFEVTPPPEMAAAHDATLTDPSAARNFGRRFPFYTRLIRAGSRFQLSFPDYAFGQDRGTAYSGRRNGSFTITGDRLTTTMPVHNWGQCYIEFAPNNQQAFEGVLACNAWPKLAILAKVL